MQPKIVRRWESIPGMMSTADGLMEYADRLSRSEFDKRGHCRTQFILVRDVDAVIVSTPWTDDVEKEIHLAWIRDTFAGDRTIVRFAQVAEVWEWPLDEMDNIKPGDPTDGLIIIVQDRDGSTKVRSYTVQSGEGRRKNLVNMREDVAEFDGRMAELFGQSARMSPGR